MTLANLVIALGTVLIAIGGLVVTYGWNMRSTQETRMMLEERARAERNRNRAEVLKSLGAEFNINIEILKKPPINEIDEVQLGHFVVITRLQTTATASAIARGTFTDLEDRPLFTSLMEIQELMTDFNNRIQTSETQMLRGDIAMWRTKLRDGAVRKSLIERLITFGHLLIKNGLDPDYAPFYSAPTSSPGNDR